MVIRVSKWLIGTALLVGGASASFASTDEGAAAPANTVVAAQPASAAALAPEARLFSISYRLAHANAHRCEQPDMMTGAALHDMATYDESARAAVGQRFGMTKGFGVRLVVAGGAADRAGLRVGDEIMAINGQDLAQFRTDLIRAKASYDRVEALNAHWTQALKQGATQLIVRRGTESVTLDLTADAGCGGEPALMQSRAFNAWSDGHYVAVTTRIIEFVQSDDELAFVIAHEMAHNMLHHDSYGGTTTLLFGNVRGERKQGRTAEIQADGFAIELMTAADYKVDGAVSFLTRSRPMRPFDLPIGHPGIGSRIAAVRAAPTATTGVGLASKAPASAVEQAIVANQPTELASAAPAATVQTVVLAKQPTQLALTTQPMPFPNWFGRSVGVGGVDTPTVFQPIGLYSVQDPRKAGEPPAGWMRNFTAPGRTLTVALN